MFGQWVAALPGFFLQWFHQQGVWGSWGKLQQVINPPRPLVGFVTLLQRERETSKSLSERVAFIDTCLVYPAVASVCCGCVSSSAVLSPFEWWWIGMAKWWTHTVSVSVPGTDLIPEKISLENIMRIFSTFPSHLINFLWSFGQNETSHLPLAEGIMWRCECFTYYNQNTESTELNLNGT